MCFCCNRSFSTGGSSVQSWPFDVKKRLKQLLLLLKPLLFVFVTSAPSDRSDTVMWRPRFGPRALSLARMFSSVSIQVHLVETNQSFFSPIYKSYILVLGDLLAWGEWMNKIKPLAEDVIKLFCYMSNVLKGFKRIFRPLHRSNKPKST